MSEVQGAEAAPSVEQLRAQASVVGHAAAPFAQAAAEAARPSPDKEPVGDKLEFDGAVQEILPNKMYRVKADNGLGVLATISRRMLQYYIAIRPGDRVTVEVSPYDPSRGRITYRHK
ncbi:translation initiation factor IF-1 [Corallococcus sp. ZKHCc1 1396]|uniref:Translation initiation factor IF-1 n=1 Tax=Corallococcus soli TaxID=2710757 RepID=A0ABR9PVN6_9BACT|nr:translation initiation factor IF-1 [Corallococcus soli]